jgi:hypothetical protein
MATGWPAIDQPLGGGLPRGAVTEMVGETPSSGSALALRLILRTALRQTHWTALVDGSDGFDAGAWDLGPCPHFLWVRCHQAAEAIQATDLLLHDGNLPLVLLDLRQNPLPQLRRIPSSTWHRLQRLTEQAHAALLVVTPFPLVATPFARCQLSSRFTLETLEEENPEQHLQLVWTRRRHNALAADATPAMARAATA